MTPAQSIEIQPFTMLISSNSISELDMNTLLEISVLHMTDTFQRTLSPELHFESLSLRIADKVWRQNRSRITYNFILEYWGEAFFETNDNI